MLPLQKVSHTEVSMMNDRKSTGLMRSSTHQRGVTSIEYALIASVIGMAILVGLGAVGQGTFGLWTSVVTKFLAALGVTA
jgi:Flp pilus assembly pilin Flp